MKKKCGFKARQCPQFVVKSLGLALSLATIVAVNGCGKKDTSASTSNTTAQSVPAQPVNPTPRPVQAPAQPVTVSQTPQMQANARHAAPAPSEPDLGEINRSLIRWIVGNRRKPSSFEEFASSSGAQIPPPPAGKKYVIGANMHVQLVNQ